MTTEPNTTEMSTTRTVRAERRVNDYTVVIEQGTEDGLEVGQRVRVDVGDRQTRGRIFDVVQEKAVVQLLESDVESYSKYVR